MKPTASAPRSAIRRRGPPTRSSTSGSRSLNAILARVPDARFGVPDIASNSQWFSTIASRLADDPLRPHIACISHHYYIGGPPSNPEMTVDRILRPNPVVTRDAALVTAAANKLNVRYRMTEGNTCYRGGKPGVSDAFAAALWAADYCLQLASLGYAGVNLHGGDGQMVANSLGGHLPGDDLVLAAHGDPATHPHPYYTPIARIGDKYLLEPVAYGMKFAGMFADSTMTAVDFNPGGVNATAYAAVRPQWGTLLAIINKDREKDLPLPSWMYPSPDHPLGFPSFQVLTTLDAASVSQSLVMLPPGRPDTLPKMIPRSSAVLFSRARG